MLNKIFEIFKNYVLITGPLGMALGTFFAVVVVFVPDEIILITAGSLIPDIPTLFIYTICAGIGGYLGGIVFYLIGHKSKEFAYNFVDKYGKWLLIDRHQVEYSEKEFEKRGKLFVFWGRFLPGVKSVISIPAGIIRMDFLTYSIFSILGIYIWYSILLTLGYVLKSQIMTAFDLISKYEKIGYVIVAIIAIVYIVKMIIDSKKDGRDSGKRIS